MQCPKCSNVNPPEAKFCGRCGERLTPPVPPIPTPSTPPVPGQPGTDEGVSDGMKIGIAIGSLFVPILGIVMGIVYMNDRSPAKKKAGKLWLLVGIGAFIFGCLLIALAQAGANYQSL